MFDGALGELALGEFTIPAPTPPVVVPVLADTSGAWPRPPYMVWDDKGWHIVDDEEWLMLQDGLPL